MGALAVLLMVALFFFVFNPLGLGPEPETVLSSEFFTNPARDLSELELLVDGKEAFNEIFKAIDSAESSVYIQTYICKDDSTGQAVVAKLKAAADRITPGADTQQRQGNRDSHCNRGDHRKCRPECFN